MTGRQAAVLGLPAVLVLLLALPAGSVGGPVHPAAAGVAVGLTVPAAFGTFWLTRWMAARHPQGGVVGMLVGTALRVLVAFGGGAVVFLLTPMFREAVLGYWVWVLFAYLASLVAETALLVRLSPVGGGAAGGKG
jgi:hypothetical protein